MSSPSLDDLRLVLTVARLGSVGAAARELRVAQPSASARLAALERRAGVRLFERDTTGSRPTAAGHELVERAGRILGQVDGVLDAARAAAAHGEHDVGTFVSFAATLVPVVEALLPRPVRVTLDHGPELVEAVAQGALDLAVVTVAGQMRLPRGVRAVPLGTDPLVVLRSAGTPAPGRGRRPLAGHRVVYTSYDLRGPQLRERLERLGGRAELGPTLATSVALARTRGAIAVVPRTALAHDRHEDDEVSEAPLSMDVHFSLVTGRDPSPEVDDLAEPLGRALGLDPPVSRAGARATRRGPRG